LFTTFHCMGGGAAMSKEATPQRGPPLRGGLLVFSNSRAGDAGHARLVKCLTRRRQEVGSFTSHPDAKPSALHGEPTIPGSPAPPAVLALAALALTVPAAAPFRPTRKGPPSFEKDVRPVLAAHCLRCHTGARPKARLDLGSRAGMLKGG